MGGDSRRDIRQRTDGPAVDDSRWLQNFRTNRKTELGKGVEYNVCYFNDLLSTSKNKPPLAGSIIEVDNKSLK